MHNTVSRLLQLGNDRENVSLLGPTQGVRNVDEQRQRRWCRSDIKLPPNVHYRNYTVIIHSVISYALCTIISNQCVVLQTHKAQHRLTVSPVQSPINSLHVTGPDCSLYSVSQKKVAPQKKLFAIFSLVVNLCNWKLPWLLPKHSKANSDTTVWYTVHWQITNTTHNSNQHRQSCYHAKACRQE